MATQTKSVADDEFRRRALAEAARYGSDPLVFVRELLQNARDAGARRVEIVVSRHGPLERVRCRDDGRGMSYEHARRYLFALYASSKEASSGEAGKFGVGFWSVLRFEPSRITVRSRAGGDAWEMSLDGSLETATASGADLETGTEIVLERPAVAGRDLAADVARAARRYGRFLTTRDDPERPLPLTVDGRAVNARFSLPEPSAAFRRRGFRGVVGLGTEPRVEVFAQGLFVRAASSLKDLGDDAGDGGEKDDVEDTLAGLRSLAPRVLIDSAELDLLLARSDARYDRHLRRLLKVTERQLRRLITRQLQALHPQPWYRLLWGALRDRLEPHLGWHLAPAALLGLVLGLAALWWLPSGPLDSARTTADRPLSGPAPSARPDSGEALARRDSDPGPAEPTAGATGLPGSEPSGTPGGVPAAPSSRRATTAAGRELRPYVDLASNYQGPRPGSLAGDRSHLAMVYEPAAAAPYFNALVVDDLDGERWLASPATEGLARYRGGSCAKDCVGVSLMAAGGQRSLRLPVPTGHRLDPASVRLGDAAIEVLETAAGEAVIFPSETGSRRGASAVLRYVTGPAPQPDLATAPLPADPPAELASVAEKLRRLPRGSRVQPALDYVARRVSYERSTATARSFQGAVERGADYVEAALDLGAGDCDVQSGVLVTLLRLAGVEARLALGYVGVGGAVAPGLHAWVEVRDDLGGWQVADASLALEGTAGDRVAGGGAAGGGAAGPAETPPLVRRLVTPAPLAAGAAPDASSRVATVLALLAAAGALVWTLRRRAAGARAAGAGAHADLAALLGGALRHPDAFARLPAMFHGRFVPLVGRSGGLSLDRARRLAGTHRLFRSATGSRLALSAAGRRVPVIDASTAEGRVLSLALGAVDLDRWSSLLESSRESELSRRINRRLDRLGAPWRLRQADQDTLDAPWVEIALEDLKLGRRLILFDLSAPELAPARAQLEKHPDAAAFSVLDALLHRLDVDDRERARVLAGFARRVVVDDHDRET